MTWLEVVTVLEGTGDQRAVPALVGALEETRSPVMRYTIIQALGKLGDVSAIAAISRYMMIRMPTSVSE